MGSLTDAVLISVFLSFPEAILILMMGFRLCNLKVDIKKTVRIGGLQSGIAFFLIVLSLETMGIHTILQMLSLWIFVSIVYKMKLYKAIIPVLLGFFIVGILQGIYFPIFNQIYGIDFYKLGAVFKYTVLLSLPVYIITILLLIIVYKNKITFCNISLENEERQL